MKKLADDLKFVNKEINALSKKLEQLSKKAAKLMKAAPKKKAVKKAKATPVKAAPKKKVAKKIKAAPAKKTVKKKVAKKTAAPKKPAGKPSATPTSKVLTLMKRYKKGIAISKLKERSGLNDKQISNILHRASKEGKIKRVARGVYQLA